MISKVMKMSDEEGKSSIDEVHGLCQKDGLCKMAESVEQAKGNK
jgi:hypothetical protein